MLDRAESIRLRLKAPLLLVGATLLLWVAVEALLYRSGAYFHVAEPESNTGAVVTARLLLQREYRPGARNVLVFGDSRVGEGFSPKLASSDGGDIHFINLSVPGSTPRTWYYLLRAIDADGYRFAAVLVGTLYAPRDASPLADWTLDPMHQAPLLGLQDLGNYPAGFVSPPMRERARNAILFPALSMRQDTLAALSAPWRRWHKLYSWRPGFLGAVVSYPGRDEVMPPLTFAADASVRDWRDANPAQRALVKGHLADLQAPRDAALVQANDAYLATWLGRLSQLAARRDARLILFPLPRGPYRELQPARPAAPVAIAAIAGQVNASALPADLFEALEHPTYFFDVVHLNRAGRERMSTTVGARVRALLDAEAR